LKDTQAILQKLRQVPLFAQLTDNESSCIEGGEEIGVKAGEEVATEGEQVECFFVLLEGEMRVLKKYGNQEIVLAVHKAGAFFGEVSLLLDVPYVATFRALQPCRVFRLKKDPFWKLLGTCPSVASQILRTMAARLRGLEGFSSQREKLVSLGTMAAGLAHELNNPAAAARRTAGHLRETTHNLQDFACTLNQQLTHEQWGILVNHSQDALDRASHSVPTDVMNQSDREEALAQWLENHGVADGWKLAPTLAGADLDQAWLDTLAAGVPSAALTDVLGWLEARLALNSLLEQIEQSTTRIEDLVKTVKAYSYMDKTALQPVDIHEGLESTLTMLCHRLKNIRVVREYDRTIPRIMGRGSELNQVWTNLIGNAIDAVSDEGRIWVRTKLEDNSVMVEIADDGAGIPPEIQPRIFEPFFTTKAVGSGTGLGLLISYRIVADGHHGEIEFESKPGDTRFLVRLPITPPVEKGAAAFLGVS